MTSENRYLYLRGKRWHFMRRVPELYRGFDKRDVVRRTLRTESVILGRARRDAIVAADDAYWAAMIALDPDTTSPDMVETLTASIERRHKAAYLQAVASVAPRDDAEFLMRDLAISELAAKVEQIAGGGMGLSHRIGQTPAMGARLSEALALYRERIAVRHLVHKSADQQLAWRRTFERAVKNFIAVSGDKPIGGIVRSDALKFYTWWVDRLKPKIGGKTLSSASANRELGALRKLHREYLECFGEEEVSNPFKGLSFKRMPSAEVPAFDDEWVRSRILAPGALTHMNREARNLIYVLIETGTRTSEIANLRAADIFLNGQAPFIKIRPRQGWEIKTHSSIRTIPVVGVALEALGRQQKGFPRCRNRSDRLSAYLMRTLRDKNLMPTPAHRIYSFRHAFERRTLEAGLDFELRCRLMGHAPPRPSYGGGGSIAWQRDQLMKIAHPYEQRLFEDVSSFEARLGEANQ